jgi:membrane-associated protease RseP (regulator of RpoE activity)
MRRYWVAIVAGSIGVCALDARAQAGGAQIPQTVVPRSPVQAPGQPIESCIAGRIFGITQFQCTYCGMASPRDSTHVVYSFGAEPLVVETDNPTLKPGDRIVAVNGNPITTRAGADHFAYPPLGTATITVRRNNVNVNIEQPISSARYCPVQGYRILTDSLGVQRIAAGPIAMGRGGGGRGGARSGGRGGAGGITRTDSAGAAQLDSVMSRMRGAGAGGRVAVLRSATPDPIQHVQISNFGFALACQPVCTIARSRDGTTQYSRYDAYPVLSNVLPASAAGRAGLRDGDVLILVNGVSPMVEEGALILHRAGRETTLQLEVRRGDKTEKITLKL